MSSEIVELLNKLAVASSTLRRLEEWFDTDQEILDAMEPNELLDHLGLLEMIRRTLAVVAK